MLFQEPLNEQDQDHLAAIIQKMHLDKRVNIDDLEPRPESNIKQLHPTLKKCKCGMIGSKHLFLKHMDVVLAGRRQTGEDPKIFWSEHGEVPYNIGEEQDE